MAKFHGSQCGFCTPGIVMSMYTLLRNNPQPALMEMESAFEGEDGARFPGPDLMQSVILRVEEFPLLRYDCHTIYYLHSRHFFSIPLKQNLESPCHPMCYQIFHTVSYCIFGVIIVYIKACENPWILLCNIIFTISVICLSKQSYGLTYQWVSARKK